MEGSEGESPSFPRLWYAASHATGLQVRLALSFVHLRLITDVQEAAIPCMCVDRVVTDPLSS
jgi:hypothetical protein